ncbi:MAG: type II CAAX endopeptidase family protein [Pseudomonadota bacterium]
MELTSFADWPLAISIMLAILLVVLPIESEVSQRVFKPAILKGHPTARHNTYLYSIGSLWAFAVPILAIWQAYGLDWSVIGFQWAWGPGLMGVCIASALIVAFFAWQAFGMWASQSNRQTYAEALRKAGGAHYFMPVSSKEHRTFLCLGVTAGITEEIIFRGFLIWAFSFFMPFWTAGLVSHLVFTLMHRYQGLAGMAQVFVMGALITALYLIGGSIWPLIVLHIAVDVLNGITYRLGYLELSQQPETGPVPASEPVRFSPISG